MKKMFKKIIAILICFMLVFNYSFSIFAEEDMESSEIETTYTETIETTESIEEIEEIEEDVEEHEEKHEEIESSSKLFDEEALDDFSKEIINVEDDAKDEAKDEAKDDKEEIEDSYAEEIKVDVEEHEEKHEEVESSSKLFDEEVLDDFSEEITNAEDVIEEVNEDKEEEHEEVESSSKIIDGEVEEEDGDSADIVEEIEEVSLLGAVSSPSNIEEETESNEEEVEEATISEIVCEIEEITIDKPLLGAPITVTTWEELKASIDSSSAGDTIILGSDIIGDSAYTVEATKDVTIDLHSHTIDMNNTSRAFTIKGKLTIDDNVGGGTITGGYANSGAVFLVRAGAILTINNGIFTGNTTAGSGGSGGVVYIEGSGTFIMNGGKFSGNSSFSAGGCIFSSGTFIMNGGEISGNNATNRGGAISANNGEMYLNGGKIINNKAYRGGAIFLDSWVDKVCFGGTIVVKDNYYTGSNIENTYISNGSGSKLEISNTNPLTSGAEIYVTVYFDNVGDWGEGKNVGQYFNGTMTDDNYQYFYFTNSGAVEKNVIYGVVKTGSDYVTAIPPVCKIGTAEYVTLEDALNAVTSGQTITMLADINYSNGTNFIIDGKTVTIDFGGHSMTVNTTSTPTITNLFTVTNSGNLTIDGGEIKLSGTDANTISPFTVSGSNSKLTLINVTQESCLDKFLTLNGGTATINGGTFGASDDNILINLSNNANIKLTNNPTFNCQGNIINAGDISNTDIDTITANVTIDNATLNSANAASIIALYGNANVTISDGTFTSSNVNSAPIYVGNYGYKSSVTINNLTSDSPYVFKSESNTNIESFTATINDGYFKYTKGQFAIDSSNTLKPNVILNGGFYGPNVDDADALSELEGFCASGKIVETLSSSASEYANGYRYKVYSNTPTPTPTPTPPSGGGGSSSGGSDSAGAPRYDSSGNILGPSGISDIRSGMQNYIYDGNNAPNLTGNIVVVQWDYDLVNVHVANIHYAQNIDSFVINNNIPVVAEWVGVSINDNSKVLWYRTNENGQVLRNQFILIKNNIYYFDNNGIMATGQRNIGGKIYNFDTTVGANEGRLLY